MPLGRGTAGGTNAWPCTPRNSALCLDTWRPMLASIARYLTRPGSAPRAMAAATIGSRASSSSAHGARMSVTIFLILGVGGCAGEYRAQNGLGCCRWLADALPAARAARDLG